MNRRNNGNRNENDGNGNDGGSSLWQTAAAAAAVAAGAVAVVGGLGYLLTKGSTTSSVSQASAQTDEHEQTAQTDEHEQRGFLDSLADSLQEVDNSNQVNMEREISQHDVPSRPDINNLNSLLADIHVRYIALKKEDFQRHYRVFDEVFRKLHENMKAVDKYYERYASNVQFDSSHYDRLRINKPNKFDVDIVIGMPDNMNSDPINPEESDIVFEQKLPGFVQLRAGKEYQKILVGDGQNCLINKTAHEWLDDENYILRSKFTDWCKSVGQRGLERFPRALYSAERIIYVDGVQYSIRKTSSGSAWTIIIESDGFRLDVDLVPALKFPETRWLGGAYREIPLECRREYWMVVPKPHKAGQTPHDDQRSWRVALQDQEKRLLKNTYNLQPTIRLLEKLRDAQGMKGIASYHIKTLFFWEVLDKKNIDPTFWQRSDIATLFKHMLQKFYEALEKQNIPYFWNKKNNMIEDLNTNLVNEDKRKLIDLLKVLLQNPCDHKLVARYLLTSEEYQEYQSFL